MNLFNTKTTTILAVAAMLAFCACSQEPAAPESSAPGTITLNLGAENPGTRVTFENDITFKFPVEPADKVEHR